MMKELNNLISGNEIDIEYHNKIFNNDLFEKSSITLKKDNIIVFHPAMNISSQFCKMLKSGYIYLSYPSLLCR